MDLFFFFLFETNVTHKGFEDTRAPPTEFGVDSADGSFEGAAASRILRVVASEWDNSITS